MHTTVLPPPASFFQTTTFPSPAAPAFHGMSNAASHLPSVSRDARYAYRTRIPRTPSSPCRHRPPKRLADSPCTPLNTQTHQLPNRTPRATLPTVPLHPTSLAHSTTTPTGACTAACASPSPAPSDALSAAPRCSRQKRLARLRFALSRAHSAPLRCITPAHWKSLGRVTSKRTTGATEFPTAKTHLHLPPLQKDVAKPAAPLCNTKRPEARSLQTHRRAIPLRQTTHNRLGTTPFRPLRWTPRSTDVPCI